MATAPKLSKAPEPGLAVQIGDLVLERYRIVEQIASGGHSVVFRGQDERLARPVCIKVFSGLGRGSGVGRTSYEHFVQEAFALSRLTHPNTLRIYDFGHVGPSDAEGMPLQVCEFMNGGTLAQLVREQGPQSVAETAQLVTAMCLALGEAHGLGIVHRDIKPQNILFGAVGGTRLPKLADFGIAKWSSDGDRHEQRAQDTAVVAGHKLAMYSPSWAAPEQLAGQPVSPASDIYSLGCVAVYMLSGKAIFAEEDVYAGYRKRRQADDRVREALAPLGIPPPLIRLLARALAFDPRHRLDTVEALARELAHAIDPAASRADPLHSATTSEVAAQTGASDPGIDALRDPPQIAASQQAPQDAPSPVISAVRPSPGSVQPWMASAQPPRGAIRRLVLSEAPQSIADRRGHCLHAPNHMADLLGPHNSRIRVTFFLGPGGSRVFHLKGLTCFVALLGGRPSPAVQVEHSSDIALVTPRAQELGYLRVVIGSAETGQTVFPVGAESVALAVDDCIDPILFDFGPGSEAHFVYTRGRPIPKLRRS
jgi:serine/threonine-protein kinase